MDPVSHAALGRTLISAVTSSPRPSRAAAVAAVLGSLSPDLDFVLMPFGWDIYLRAHEIGTHSMIGSLCSALLTAAVVRLFARGAAYRDLARAACLGALSHVVLDLVSSARVRVAWPAADAVVSVPLVAMADPWLLALTIAGPIAIWRVRRNGRNGTANPSRVDAPDAERRAARLTLAAIALFLTVKGGLGMLAISRYEHARDSEHRPVIARVIEAQWASLATWHVFDRTPDALRAWRASAGGAVEKAFEWPLEQETPPVTASRALATVKNFLRAHELGFAISGEQPADRVAVMWSDIRFCRAPGATAAPPTRTTVRSGPGMMPIACALWFGGELSRDGTPLRQIVRIGNVTQTRDPAR
jgi:membrane-bound metal-dependent hydrolase YbcI (DUF457 family)